MINLDANKLNVFNSYLGQGNFKKASLVFFGNESGTSNNRTADDIYNHIVREMLDNKVINFKGAFTLRKPECTPLNSVYIQFMARFLLALENNDEKWFKKLSKKNKLELNKYIKNKLNRNYSCNINLRPLPRSTERHWDYKINEKQYLKSFNFTSKNISINQYNSNRLTYLINIFKYLFDKGTPIISIGDMKNKKSFFELFFNINLIELSLNKSYKIYYNLDYKLLLTNYWDNKNGLGLKGLHKIYKFIKDEKIF